MSVRTIKTTRSSRTAPIRQLATRTTSARSSGFTLIEILIVLAIISLVMALGLPAIERITQQRLYSTARKFIGLIRTIRQDAILLNSVHRLAINFEERTYWVENQKQFDLIGNEPPPKKKALKTPPPPSNFTLTTRYTSSPVSLPGGVAVEGVLKEREGLLAANIAYIHFFPNGFGEKSILYLNREGAKTPGVSLVVRPTTGKVDFYQKRVQSFEEVP